MLLGKSVSHDQAAIPSGWIAEDWKEDWGPDRAFVAVAYSVLQFQVCNDSYIIYSQACSILKIATKNPLCHISQMS
jgi:hypothetical protein